MVVESMYFSSSQQHSMVEVALLLVVYNVDKLAVNHATEEKFAPVEGWQLAYLLPCFHS